jgi:hypothetical protein
MREGFVPSGSALQSAPGLYFHQPMVKYAGVATEKDRVSERIKLGNAEAVLHEIERSVDWQPVNRGKIGTARRLINEVLEALK